MWAEASTAAPTYFPPEVVTFAPGTPDEYSFIFVDGGVTTYNNPACLAFQMATASPYALNWAIGANQLLVVLVGTGGAAKARPTSQANDLWLLDNAKNVLAALMNAASAGWDMTCRTLGLSDIDPAWVQTLDSVQYIEQIQRVGQAYAAQHVLPTHFRGFV